jgi:hypothetical protein
VRRYASNHVIRLVRSMFNKASQWGMFDGRNPAVGVKLFRQVSPERFLRPTNCGVAVASGMPLPHP